MEKPSKRVEGMKHAWTIYNPIVQARDLHLFNTKKEAETEFNRIYSGAIGDLIKDYAPKVRVIKVTFEL